MIASRPFAAAATVQLAALVLFSAQPGAAPAQPPTGSWTRVADLRTPRSAHAAVATSEAIYALAGTGGDGKPVLAMERFDGKTWSVAGRIPSDGLNAPAAAVLADTIYLIGGFGTTTNLPMTAVHRYDLRTKTWSVAAPLPAPRGGHAAVVLDGKIHVVGGGNSQSTIDDHSLYDPRTDTWTERTRLPRRMGSPAVVALNGKLYSVGGRSGPEDFGDVYVYDPAADAWTPGPAIAPRGTGGAAVLDGAIYYFGGESQPRHAVLADVLRLAPRASVFTSAAPMPLARSYGRAVVWKNAVYIVGGSTEYGASHSSRGAGRVDRFALK